MDKGGNSKRIRDAVQRKVMPFRMADLKKELPDVSRDMIRLVLRTMKKEGRIRAEGRGPAARWIPMEQEDN